MYWKGCCFKVLSKHFPGATKEHAKKTLSLDSHILTW
jgi:hypothetical protein